MVISLELGADLHMVQMMPLPLTVSCFSKIQTVLPFWYRLTRVVPNKGPLNSVRMYVLHLGRVFIYPHSILYIVSTCDQRNGIHLGGLST